LAVTETASTATVILMVFVMFVVSVVPVRIPVCVPESILVSVLLPVVVLELPYAVTSFVEFSIEDVTFFFRERIIFMKFPRHTTDFVSLFFQLPDFLASQRPRFYSIHNPLMLAFHAIHQVIVIMITSGMGRHCHEYTE
jgi:hypothetical protein